MKNAEPDTYSDDPITAALKSEAETWTPDCLPPERIIALIERSVPEAEANPLMAHVALCARCRREYSETVELMQLAEEVQALEAQAEAAPSAAPSPSVERPADTPANTQSTPRIPWWRSLLWPGVSFGFGAAAAGVALFLAYTAPLQTQRDSLASNLKEKETQVARAEREKSAMEQELRRHEQQSQGNTSRYAKELEELSKRAKTQEIQIARLEKESAVLQEMPLPSAEWMLASERGQLRGGNQNGDAVAIQLMRPVNAATLETTPTLECQPVSGATEYQVSLEREGSNEEIPAPKPLSATRWQVATPLREGKVYKWAVTARRGSEQLRSSFVKFYVLSPAQRQEIEAAQKQYARSPLTLGAVYARMGMLSEAEQQFRAALKEDPSQSIAKRWLQEIQERRRNKQDERG